MVPRSWARRSQFPVRRSGRDLSPHSSSSEPVVEESVSPISYKTRSPDPKSRNPVLPRVNKSDSVLEVQKIRNDKFPVSKVDNEVEDSSSFPPAMECSVENFEEFPKPMSVTEKVKSTKMFICMEIIASYSKKIKIFQNCKIHYFLHADEPSRRDSKRKSRFRTTKKEDFL